MAICYDTAGPGVTNMMSGIAQAYQNLRPLLAICGVHTIDIGGPFVAFKKEIEDPENNPFRTPSGEIEVYSKILADVNNPEIPSIPEYIEAWESRNDPMAKTYPLQPVTSHMGGRVHSSSDNVPLLKEVELQALWINSIDAQARGTSNGDEVRVLSTRGEMIIPCWVTERIMSGVVHLHEGGPFRPDENGIDRGGCPNIFLRSGYTPAGCFATNSALVKVEKA